MFNSIILDKSAFESLNIDEIFFLHQYYFPIVPHILIIEILADLKAEKAGRDSQERVKQLAYKILQLNPKYTAHYQGLIEHELRGEIVEMGRRPNVGHAKSVISDEGQKGVVIKDQFEEEMLDRWRSNKFEEAERFSAEEWRKSIEGNKIDHSGFDRPEKIKELKNLGDVLEFVDSYLKAQASQRNIFTNAISLYRISPLVASELFYKLETGEITSLYETAPYCYFCYRIFLVFSLALARGLITARQTDIIDLQYLYYLPFTSLFSSDDKFHKMLTPLFLDSDQTFITGEDLKSDLRRLVELRDEQDTDKQSTWVQKHRQYPPDIASSFTTEMWLKNVPKNVRQAETFPSDLTPEQQRKIVEKTNRLSKSAENPNQTEPFSDEDTDFIIIERKVRGSDFCPCRSGKLFKDCCLDRVMKKNT